jgi:TonB-linked SusC/RagA family outer membrane protein
MGRLLRYVIFFALAVVPMTAQAQQAGVVTGRVSDAAGAGIANASVFITSINVGTLSRSDGTYTLTVPASRITAGEQLRITAQSLGHASETQTVTLSPGGSVAQNFTLGLDVLELEGIVAVGQGISQERRAVAATINSVDAEEITQSRESNVVAALAGKAPNVEVTTSSGEPGAGAYIRIRGSKTLSGDGQPLFVVDGVPIENRSFNIENIADSGAPRDDNNVAGTVVQNRAADINPNDIASVEILKGAAASAIYGSRAANGVVLITTKRGVSGQARVSYGFQYGRDDVNQTHELQTRYGRGRVDLDNPSQTLPGTESTSIRAWGALLPAGTPTFDHSKELYDTGHTLENNLTLSGGNEVTTYYLSLGRSTQDGVFKGPNNTYDRNTVRLKADHQFLQNLTVGGNFSFAESGGRMLQTGSNISGLQLGALRTPPEFNNCRQDGGYDCYLNPSGLHYSYRTPSPSSVSQSRGFDNPFWTLYEVPNTTDVGRFFGNINLDYQPLDWLNVSYILGADYMNDERLTVIPKGSSDFPEGRMVRADLVSETYDSNLLVTLNYAGTESLNGSLTLGQNLNQTEFSRYQVNGQTLIFGTDQLDFAIDKIPNEYREKVRTDGYFAQANVNVWDQLFLTGALRLDGSSTFGGDNKRFLYPKASAAYDLSRLGGIDRLLDFAKVRVAYGVAGVQPPVYSNISGFRTATLQDGWITPNGLETIYAGNDGVVRQLTQGDEDIEPERTREWEAGFDLAFLDNRAAFSLTYYDQRTTDAILQVDVPPSTGFAARWANGAEFDNNGWEATLDLVPVQTPNFGWDVGLQYARNNSCVRRLGVPGRPEVESILLNGFSGGLGVEVAAPERNEDGEITTCHPFNVFVTDDFIRFGFNATSDEGIAIDDDPAYAGTPKGTLYIGEDGFPQYDGQLRVTGDPNPDWTGSIRNTVTMFNNLRVSALFDISMGNDMLNGTRGAIYSYGTSAINEAWHGAGKDTIFPGVGPGEGTTVNLNWDTWGENGLGNSFTGPSAQFIEDASFVKLRDISVTYTLDQPWLRRVGVTTADLTLAGRNLKTWTDYSGLDPESNLTGQTLGRGIDYFNNPRTRSFVFGVQLHR